MFRRIVHLSVLPNRQFELGNVPKCHKIYYQGFSGHPFLGADRFRNPVLVRAEEQEKDGDRNDRRIL
jgi:hypothetical protein